MKPYENKDRADYTVIMGCGRLGAGLAGELSDEERNVLVIDRDKDSFRKLPPSFGGLTLTGDAQDMNVLHEAQIEKATAIVVVTDNDNTNIMIAQMAKELYKKECVITRLYDAERSYVYRDSGIHTICPAVLSSNEIRKLLTQDGKEPIA
jgi:trk system potassium uptake protein TrkA